MFQEDTKKIVFDKSIYQMFEETAKQNMNSVAYIYESDDGREIRLTYRELLIAVNDTAEAVYEAAPEGNCIIGVYAKRSHVTAVAMLAIWKTGNVYVPLDLSFSDSYIRFIMKDTEMKLLLTQEPFSKDFQDADVSVLKLDNFEHKATEKNNKTKYRHTDKSSAETMSFIMYTSGTTGNPKGVKHRQYQLINRCSWGYKTYPFQKNDVACQRTNVNFMPSMWGFLGGLLQGIPTVIIADALVKDTYRFIDLIVKHKITTVFLVPSMLKRILEMKDGPKKLAGLRHITVGGEPLTLSLYKSLNELLPGCLIVDDYGSTEMNGVLYFDNTEYDKNAECLPPLKEVSHIRALVLNEEKKPCGVKEEGDLYIGGISLALGYVNLPEEEAERFVLLSLDQGPKERFYATGDRAFYDQAGGFYIIGRSDNQVKIRGIRTELTSVEEQISRLDSVRECGVTAQEIHEGVKVLVAFIVPADECEFEEQKIREEIRNRVPEHMVPNQIIAVDEIPKTESGKIKRVELCNMYNCIREAREGRELEHQAGKACVKDIKTIAAGILMRDVSELDEADKFKDMGFDSLTLIDFLNNVNKTYGMQINAAELFDHPTIKAVVDLIQEKQGSHLAKEQILPGSWKQQEEKVAVIGISGRFPDAENPEELWKNLTEGKCSIREVPPDRWDAAAYYDEDIKTPGKSVSKWGGFLKNIELFDASFFQITPREAVYMDPQQRICLEECWKALEDAGYQEQELELKKIGVFVGARQGDYSRVLKDGHAEQNAYGAMGCDNAVLSARLSYYLNLKGCAVSVDTACSSSLTAMHFAYRSILSGDCEAAVVCGVNVMSSTHLMIESSKMGILSPEGKLCTFDDSADGTVVSEGAGAVVLKKLRDSIRDRNHIYGVIIGSGINQDGRTNGITAPSAASQEELMRTVMQKHQIDAGKITYMECHGTGTKLGDMVEMQSIANVHSAREGKLVLGALKSNIGHTAACSGIAGIIKILLAFRHGEIPPVIHLDMINSHFKPKSDTFLFNKNKIVWPSPRVAGINSFGFSGTNVHMILEEYNRPMRTKRQKECYLIPLSAKTVYSLEQKRIDLLNWLKSGGSGHALEDIAYTLQRGRSHFRYRQVFLVKSIQELITLLEEEGEAECLDIRSGLSVSRSQADLELAERYCAGDAVNWIEINRDSDGEIIAMPSYPFDRQRYWAESLDGDGNPVWSMIYPLNSSDLKISDHRIHGACVLAGAVQLDLVLKSAGQQFSSKCCSFETVKWFRTMQLEEGAVKEVKIQYEGKNGKLTYQLYESEGEEAQRLLSRGILVLKDPVRYSETIDVGAEKIKLCQNKISGEELYRFYKEHGIEYLSSYRVVEQVYFNQSRMLACLSMKLKTASGAVLIPQILDGAFHSILGARIQNEMIGTYVPFSMNKLTVFECLQETCVVLIDLLDENGSGRTSTGYLHANLTICSPDGKVLAKAEDFTIVETHADASDEMLYFTPAWVMAESSADMALAEDGRIYFFSSKSQSPQGSMDGNTVWVRQGKKFAEISSDVYEVGTDGMSYQNLVKAISRDCEDFGIRALCLAHMFSLELRNGEKDYLDAGIISLFHLIRELMHGLRKGVSVRLLFVYDGEMDDAYPYYAGVQGFFRTISLEKPEFFCRTVEVLHGSGQRVQALLSLLRKEFFDSRLYQAVRYSDRDRKVRILRQMKLEAGYRYPFKGVYVLAGGLGGLGRIIAGDILKNKEARVILLGRSALDKEKCMQLELLRKVSPQVKYVSVDILDYSRLQACIETIRKEEGPIHGVINCTGIIRDRLFYHKSPEEFLEVAMVKIRGTNHLDQLTKEDKLAFFCVFSSVASAFGKEGQSDYSYANGYLDHFTEYREAQRKEGKRCGKTVGINWGLWRSGGMKLSSRDEDRLMKEQGIKAITDAAGLNAFHQILQQDMNEIVAVAGEEARVSAFVHKEGTAVKDVEAESAVDLPRKNEVKDYLKEVISKVTLIPPETMEDDRHFDEYGMNSMMILEILEHLEEKFGKLSTTLFFEFLNLGELADYLAERYSDADPAAPVGTKTAIEPECPAGEEEPVKFEGKQVKKIAIIGLSGKYPMAANLDEFWENLKSGKDCITEVPKSRWDYRKYYSPNREDAGKVNSKWGGFLDNIDQFDPLFFHISPKEAELTDPQERLFLETVWNLMEDAGYPPSRLKDQRVGVYAGVMWGQYQIYGADPGVNEKPTSSYASVANRVSYIFDFKGPSIAVDTMCSSSITALKLAYDSLIKGEIDYAVAGGVNLITHPHKYHLLSQGHFASSDGRCRSFGDGGDGYVPGEGAGAVLLKPLEKAQRDHDRIYGVILDVHLNHGGKTNGYTVPSPVAQGKLISEALERAGILPETIGYLEAHGTGTSLGDPIEIEGIKKAFEKYTEKKQFCSIGSVKSNIGHLEAAAGIAAITKVLLQMKHEILAPSLHSQPANRNINFADSPVKVQSVAEHWQTRRNEEHKLCRRAGISSFGAGGSNGFVILEDYNEPETRRNGMPMKEIFVFSAKQEKQLRDYVKVFAEYLKRLQSKKSNVHFGLEELLHFIAESLGMRIEDVSEEDPLNCFCPTYYDLITFLEEVSECYDINLAEKPTPSWMNGTVKDLYERFLKGSHETGALPPADGTDEESNPDLSLIAYTLQTGREAMKERLAITASSADELIQAAEDYCNGIENPNISLKNPDLNILYQEDLHKDLLPVWSRNGKVRSIADLWVNGQNIVWEELFDRNGIRMTALPERIYDRKRYWITDTGRSMKADCSLFPFIDRNISTLAGTAFAKTISKQDPHIKDHIVNGKVVLPGTAVIEMGLEALKQSVSNSEDFYLKEIYWLVPVVLEEESRLIIKLERNRKEIGIQLLHDEKICAKGVFAEETGSLAQRLSTEKIDPNDAEQRLEKHECYQIFQHRGLEYGRVYQTIDYIVKKGNRADAYHHSDLIPEDDLQIHPALLDGVMQAELGFSLNEPTAELPYALKGLHIYGKLPQRFVTCLSRSGNQVSFRVYDENDQQILSIEQLELKKVLSDSREDMKHRVACLHEIWKPELLREKATEILGSLLLIDNEFTTYFQKNNLPDGTSFTPIKLEKVKSMEQNKAFSGAVFVKSTDGCEEQDMLVDSVYQFADELLELGQWFAAKGPGRKQRLLVVFTGAFQDLYMEAAAGFLKSLVYEIPGFQVKLAAADCEFHEIPSLVRKELKNMDEGILQIRYENAKRYIKVLEED